jgi:hypothetical protein
MDKKTFALNAIKPYYKDSSLCGVNKFSKCVYITPHGKKCVLGKYMLHPERFNGVGDASEVLSESLQKEILIPEAVGILSTNEWLRLQLIHDKIAFGQEIQLIESAVDLLGLFTWEEFIA